MTTGELIKSYRDRNGLSQQTVSDYLKIKREALSYYENNERDAPLEILEKLADLYSADLADFFETDPERAKTNIAFAFRAEAIEPEDLVQLAAFRKAVKNYFKICELEKKHAG